MLIRRRFSAGRYSISFLEQCGAKHTSPGLSVSDADFVRINALKSLPFTIIIPTIAITATSSHRSSRSSSSRRSNGISRSSRNSRSSRSRISKK